MVLDWCLGSANVHKDNVCFTDISHHFCMSNNAILKPRSLVVGLCVPTCSSQNLAVYYASACVFTQLWLSVLQYI